MGIIQNFQAPVITWDCQLRSFNIHLWGSAFSLMTAAENRPNESSESEFSLHRKPKISLHQVLVCFINQVESSLYHLCMCNHSSPMLLFHLCFSTWRCARDGHREVIQDLVNDFFQKLSDGKAPWPNNYLGLEVRKRINQKSQKTALM